MSVTSPGSVGKVLGMSKHMQPPGPAGTALRAARLAAGLTREQLAVRARVSSATVERAERETVRTNPSTLLSLRLALGQHPHGDQGAVSSGAPAEVAPWASALAQRAVEHETFTEAVEARMRTEALGRSVAAAGGDVEAAGAAAGAADDAGASMMAAILDDLDDDDRARLRAVALEHVGGGVAAACIAAVVGATRVTMDAPDLDEIDLATLVHIGVGLVAR